MVTNSGTAHHSLDLTRRLVAVYVAVVVVTLVALGLMSAAGSDQATSEAWVHAVIVGVFAVLLPVRLRAASRGSVGARRAVGIIATVLAVVNVVEAALPGVFPVWMRVEMVGIAALMIGVVVSLRQGARATSHG